MANDPTRSERDEEIAFLTFRVPSSLGLWYWEELGRIRDPQEKRTALEDHIALLARLYLQGPFSKESLEELMQELVDDLAGMGPLERFWRDPEVTEILVEGSEQIRVRRGGELEASGRQYRDLNHFWGQLHRLVEAHGQSINSSSPKVELSLPDGALIEARVPPAGPPGAYLRILKSSRSGKDRPYRTGPWPEDEGDGFWRRQGVVGRLGGGLSSGLVARITGWDQLICGAGLEDRTFRALGQCALLGFAAQVLGWHWSGSITLSFAGVFLFGILFPILMLYFLRWYHRWAMEFAVDGAMFCLVRAMRGGETLPAALERVVVEHPGRLAGELRRVLREVSLGMPLQMSLENLVSRVDSPSLYWMVWFLELQRHEGNCLDLVGEDGLTDFILAMKSFSGEQTPRPEPPEPRLAEHETRRLPGHADRLIHLSLAADGRSIVSASHDGSIRETDLASGEERHRWMPVGGDLTSMAVTPERKLAFAIAPMRQTGPLLIHLETLYQVRFRWDFRHNSGVVLQDGADGREIARLRDNPGMINGIRCSPDGSRLVTGCWQGSVRIYDLSSCALVTCLPSHSGPASVEFSPDGRLLATSGGLDREVRVWDLARVEQIHSLRGHEEIVTAMRFSADGSQMVTISGWLRFPGIRSRPRDSYTWEGGIDGKRVDDTIRIWDLATGQLRRRFEGPPTGVQGMAWTRDMRRLVLACQDGPVRVWDVEGGAEIRQYSGHPGGTFHAVLACDERTVFTGGADGSVREWEMPA